MPDIDKDVAAPKELEVLQNLHKTGAVNFERIGEIVKNMPETMLGPGVVADDYIVTGYSSVLKVWKTGAADFGLDEVAKVRDLAGRFQRPQV